MLGPFGLLVMTLCFHRKEAGSIPARDVIKEIQMTKINYLYKSKTSSRIPEKIRRYIERNSINLVLTHSRNYRFVAHSVNLPWNTNILYIKEEKFIMIDQENIIRISKIEYVRFIRYYLLYGLKNIR